MRNRRWLRWVLIGAGVLVVAAIAGPFIYINFIRDDAPEPFSLSQVTTTTADDTEGTNTTSVADGVDGTWTIGSGSEAGYRAKEILFGQDADTAGRTNAVTGTIEMSDSTVEAGSFSVDMASVASDEDRRDNQFRGRIMDVATYPTSTFTLTSPIELDSVPAVGEQITVTAQGDLTVRGTTKAVTVDLNARRDADALVVQGSIPIVWAEWGVPDPSFGPAQVADNGQIEFLLVFGR
jgi:polyisoprenoid-binding protein YceI